jgi:hypothetical protein
VVDGARRPLILLRCLRLLRVRLLWCRAQVHSLRVRLLRVRLRVRLPRRPQVQSFRQSQRWRLALESPCQHLWGSWEDVALPW